MASQAVNEAGGSGTTHIAAGTNSNGYSYHAEEVVRAARQELDILLRQRTELMKRIGTVTQTLVGLSALFGCAPTAGPLQLQQNQPQSVHQPGLTNACRMALLQANTPLRANQVRDRLRFQGLSLENHRNPVATVTTILRRLRKYGEARLVTLPDGKRGWEWVTQAVNKDSTET